MAFDLSKYRVLVLGSESTNTLTVLRSLGRAGIQVDLGYENPNTICRYSRYANNLFPFPDPRVDAQAWLNALRFYLRRTHYDLVLPANDFSLVPIAAHRQVFEALAPLAIPNEYACEITCDKFKTIELAQRLGISVPKSLLVHDTEELAWLLRKPTFPLVVKPVSSKVLHDEKLVMLDVCIVANQKELHTSVGSITKFCPVIIQELALGVGVGQEFLVADGEVLAAFQHQCVHEAWVSVPLDQMLLDKSKKLLKALGYNGVAMIEYKYDQTSGTHTLMEINPRFGGSLPLAVASGVDFPVGLFRWLVLKEKTSTFQYKLNHYARNLVMDMRWMQKQSPQTYSRKKTLKESWDMFAGDDLLPGFVEMAQVALDLWKGRGWKVVAPNSAAVKRLRRSMQNEMVRNLAQRLQFKKEILFICQGNICRSPFAERYANLRLAQMGNSTFRFYSAGYFPDSGRPCTSDAIQAAGEYGVDIRSHRSRFLTDLNLDRFALIVAMDQTDIEALKCLDPIHKIPVVLLGPFDGASGLSEIQDPFEKGLEQFKICYDRIRRAVDAVIGQLGDISIQRISENTALVSRAIGDLLEGNVSGLLQTLHISYERQDISPEMAQLGLDVTVVRPWIEKNCYVEGTPEDLPFDDETIDICWMGRAFSYSPWRRWSLQETLRVLKKDGHLVLYIPNVVVRSLILHPTQALSIVRQFLSYLARKILRLSNEPWEQRMARLFQPELCRLPRSYFLKDFLEQAHTAGCEIRKVIPLGPRWFSWVTRGVLSKEYLVVLKKMDLLGRGVMTLTGPQNLLHYEHRNREKLDDLNAWLVDHPDVAKQQAVDLAGRDDFATAALVLAPHPDDELLGCGGTILKMKEKGGTISVMYLTDGSKSAALAQANVFARRARRLKEVKNVAHALALDKIHFLRQTNGVLAVSEQNVTALVHLLQKSKPRWIFVPSFLDAHPEHYATNHILRAALLRHTPANLHILAYEAWSFVPPTAYCRIDEQVAKKSAALMLYKIKMRCTDLVRDAQERSNYRSWKVLGRPGHLEAFGLFLPAQYICLLSAMPSGKVLRTAA